MYLDPKETTSQKTKKLALIYKEGDPETWCEWQKQTDNLIHLMGIKDNGKETTKQELVYTGFMRRKALASY